MNKERYRIIIISFLTFFLILFFILLVAIWQGGHSRQAPEREMQVHLGNQSTSASLEWETYRNNEYGFQLQIPRGGRVEEVFLDPQYYLTDGSRLFALFADEISSFPAMYIDIYDKDGAKSDLIQREENRALSYDFEIQKIGDVSVRMSTAPYANEMMNAYEMVYWVEGKNADVFFKISEKMPYDSAPEYVPVFAHEKLCLQIIESIEFFDPGVYRNEEYGFSFRYPKEWKLQEDTLVRLSPRAIENYDIGSDNAPVHVGIYSTDDTYVYSDANRTHILSFGRYAYQIEHSRGRAPDSTVLINTVEFQRYDLTDYGRYEGVSSGDVILFVGPIMGDYGERVVFEWEEFPGGKMLDENDPEEFVNIVQSFHLDR